MELLFAIGAGALRRHDGGPTGRPLHQPQRARPGGRTLLTVTLLFWASLLAVFAVRAGAEAASASGCASQAGASAPCTGCCCGATRWPRWELRDGAGDDAGAAGALRGPAGRGLRHGPSWLLRIHIGLAFVGILAFAFATGASLLYTAQSRSSRPSRRAAAAAPSPSTSWIGWPIAASWSASPSTPWPCCSAAPRP
ncbi:MAG: hypothetical protein R3F43_18795 [bacterium]